MSRPVVVAIDGPAGVGKSTVARRLAARLGVPYLDTGAMYRTLALHALERGVDLDDPASAARAATEARIELRIAASGDAEVLLDGRSVEAQIRTPEVSAATSRIAVHPPVRERMVRLQRELVRRYGGVLEGRDIGTRVVPEARYKFFFDADPAVRAARRWGDLGEAERAALTREELARQIAERDERDRSRPASPLRPAPDAVRVDTGARTVEEVVELLADEIRRDPAR